MFAYGSNGEEKRARIRAIMAGKEDPDIASPPTEAERTAAASTIQKNYRGHRTRRELQGCSLDPSTRWMEVVKDAQYQRLTTPQAPVKREDTDGTPSQGRSKWTHATKIAQRAGADDDSISEDSDLSDSQEEITIQKRSLEEKKRRNERRAAAKAARKKTAKMMDLQYFLEMVDQKHRYGSHLRKYHSYWKTLDTDQSFFYWLDNGGGLHMDMPECSRKKLDKDQVRYLSREERLKYMVKIDEEGLLRWVKNGELVWTKDELYKDSINGIVRSDDNVPAYRYNVPPPGTESSSSSDDEEDKTMAETEENDNDHYANEDFHEAKGPVKLKYVSAGALFNHMIKTTPKKGRKWIYVADTSFNLYIGYKQSGAFQHSSFIHGSRITAAGVIKVKHGQLRSLAPLSGHYRPPADNFKSFVHSLQEEGCDMSRVSINKSYAILIGMEKYTSTKTKFDSAVGAVTYHKDRILRPEKIEARQEASRDKTESARKEKAYLEKQQSQQNIGKEKKKRGLVKRLADKLKIGNSKKEEVKQPEMSERGRDLPGTGPEDGVPAPEGKR